MIHDTYKQQDQGHAIGGVCPDPLSFGRVLPLSELLKLSITPQLVKTTKNFNHGI